MKCPKCKRDTYSAKWGSCTNCDTVTRKTSVVNASVSEEPVTPSRDSNTVTYGRASHCPTCTCVERKVYGSNAERQAAYRGRRG